MKSVSITIPTYNEERNIGNCLKSIFSQDYPKKLLQVLVIDGGSTDKTVEIAKKLGAQVIFNKSKVEEKGKPYAIKTKAKGEIIGLIDADNIIPKNPDWLKRMIAPFDNPEIWASDTIHYSFRESDNLITKYNALIGGDDPIASYFGINDRLCFFNNKWTGMSHIEKDKGDYIEVTFFKDKIPAAGSNGFFFRKSLFNKVSNDPFIHPLFVYDIVNLGHNKIAKVKQGLIHKQDGSIITFFKKKIRRIKRRHSEEIKWRYNYNIKKSDIIKNSLYIATIILPLKDMLAGYHRKKTSAWLFHPIAVFGLFSIYCYYALLGLKKA